MPQACFGKQTSRGIFTGYKQDRSFRTMHAGILMQGSQA
jgi:hypothetical protein